tara:strand:+ start:312 stop:1040 length:729 start_codon:yes stop_codon:yes gene_type:complete
MPELYSNTDDGRIIGTTAAWSTARDANNGSSTQLSEASDTNFTAVNAFASRGGGNSYRLERSFMYFNTSAITGTVASARFEIVGSSGADGSVIAVKSDAFGGDGGTTLSTGDFDAMPGWTDGASQAGNVTTYSTQITSGWNESSQNNLTGTSDLLADMRDNDVVIVCFMDYTYDYLNVTPGSTGTFNLGARFTEASSAGQRPRIDYTLATGYSHDVSGLAAANIAKVNTVATANIGKINSLD